METEEIILIFFIGIPLLICEIVMFMNRKVSLDYMLSNWYRFSKQSEFYNERGNKARKVGWIIFIVGMIAIFIMFANQAQNLSA
jgi:uncharacterized membrane protein YbaN (DUF454 family)